MAFVKSDNKNIDKVSGKNGNIIVFKDGIAQVSDEDATFLTRVPGYTIVQNAEGDLKKVEPAKGDTTVKVKEKGSTGKKTASTKTVKTKKKEEK